MTNKYKGSLRLDWINKDMSLYYEIDENEGRGIKPVWVEKNDINVSEPRIINFVKSYGDENSENMLIRGDNLLVLRTLVEQFKTRKEKDKVKCIYIDPPYNIGSAFEHYDDNLMRSEWLTMMRDRLRVLKKLLRKDGIICVQIDDTQAHYLKLLMDEVFSTENYFSTIYVQTVYPEKTLKQDRIFHDIIEQILIYKNTLKVNVNQDYEEYNWDKFEWFVQEKNKSPISMKIGGTKVEIFKKGEFEIIKKSPTTEGLKEIWASGTILDINSSGRFFRDHLTGRYKKDGLGCLYKVYGIGDDGREYRYFTGPQREGATKGKYYQGVPLRQLNEETARKSKKSIENFWNLAAEFGNCRQEGGVELKSGKKPERLIKKLLHYFTNKGDLVLDSFLGSGTTCAVAQKMNRKWIGVEIGKQSETHCLVRLNSVIDTNNLDLTGISKDEDINWKGGGGFKYYKLGESLISGNDINWNLTYKQIAEALFYAKNFKLLDDKELEKKHIFIGENLNEKGTYAICSVSKNCEFIKSEEYFAVVDKLKEQYDFDELNLYTNKAVNVRKSEQYDDVFIRKIPQTILKKYGMI